MNLFGDEEETTSKKRNNNSDRHTISDLYLKTLNFENSDEFCKLIKFTARLKKYSQYNNFLVMMQNKKTEFFTTQSQWKRNYGREIKDDARPYVILAPMGPVLFVYDLYDTYGELTPHDFLNEWSEDIFTTKGELDELIYNKLVDILKNYGVLVNYEDYRFRDYGKIIRIVDENQIVISLNINSSLPEKFTSLCHEAAHLLLGHLGVEALNYKQITKDKKHTIKLEDRHEISESVAEIEAETVAYLIAERLGLRIYSEGYLSGYIKEPYDLKNVDIDLIIKTSALITKFFEESQKPVKKPKDMDSLFDMADDNDDDEILSLNRMFIF